MGVMPYSRIANLPRRRVGGGNQGGPDLGVATQRTCAARMAFQRRRRGVRVERYVKRRRALTSVNRATSGTGLRRISHSLLGNEERMS